MTDEQAIHSCIERYYTALHTSDPTALDELFHNNAMIVGYLPDGLHQMTREEFTSFVGSQQPPPSESGAEKVLEIISCDVSGNTAGVRIRELYLGMSFIDTLAMLKVDGRWVIYNKLFHVEENA